MLKSAAAIAICSRLVFISAKGATASNIALGLLVIPSSILVLQAVFRIFDRSLLFGGISISVASLSVRNACKQPDPGPKSFLINDWMCYGQLQSQIMIDSSIFRVAHVAREVSKASSFPRE